MNREFLYNLFLLLLLNAVIKPLYLFGIDRGVQNTLPPGDYGLYFTLFNLTFLFQIVADAGLQNFNNRQIARHRHLLEKYFPALLTLKGLLGLAYLLVITSVGLLLGYVQTHPLLLALLVLWQLLNSLMLFLRSNVSGLGLYRQDSFLSVADKTILLIIMGAILLIPSWRSQLTVEGFALAQIGALGIAAIVASWFLGQRGARWRWHYHPALFRVILQQSYPYALVVLLMTAYTRIDAVMLERMLSNGAQEADYYAAAYRLLDAASMLGYLFAGLLLPMFARQLQVKQAVGPLVRLSIQLIWSLVVPLVWSIFFFAEPLMELLYSHAGDAYGAQLLRILMLTLIPVSGAYIYGTLLTAHGSLWPMNRIFMAGLVLNIALNVVLIPRFQALGAATATLATQALVFIGQVGLCWKRLPLTTAPQLALRLVGFIGVSAGSAWAVKAGLSGYWPWEAAFLASGSLGVVASFAFGLVRLSAIRQLLVAKTSTGK